MDFFTSMFAPAPAGTDDGQANDDLPGQDGEGRVRGGHAFPGKPADGAACDPPEPSPLPLPREGKATLRYATSKADLKGEDRFDLRPLMAAPALDARTGARTERIFSYFAVLDGHNGQACVDYAVDNLLLNVAESIDLESHASWEAAVPQALVDGFVRTHREFAEFRRLSGTTATAALVDGLTVYVAGAGDSRAILDDGRNVHEVTADHRVDTNASERARVLRGGGLIKRVEIGGTQHGPLRVDGTLRVSRSLGDIDVTALVSEAPEVCVVRLPPTGGRLIIASDGVWDAVGSQQVARFARKYADDPARCCERVLKKALRAKGFRDDTTVVIVDVLPADDPEVRSFADVVRASRTPRYRPPSLVWKSDLRCSLPPDAEYTPRSTRFQEGRVKVKGGVRLSGGFQAEDGLMSRPKEGHTHLHDYNRGVAKMQHEIEKSRAARSDSRRRGRKGSLRSLGHFLSYNTVDPDIGPLRGYPQKILVQKLSSHVDQ